MAQARNPYGDGQAARRITQILQQNLKGGRIRNQLTPFVG
jgi:UDP-N-acetylglucosamine 2-epimerase